MSIYNKFCEGDNNEREQMVLAATILRQDPSAFARAMQEAPKTELMQMHRMVHKTLYGESPPPRVQAGYHALYS